MHGAAVGLGINRNRAQAHRPCGADHAAGNLAAIGDQQGAKSPGTVWSDPSSHPEQAEAGRLDRRIGRGRKAEAEHQPRIGGIDHAVVP